MKEYERNHRKPQRAQRKDISVYSEKHKGKVYGTTRLHKINTEKQMISGLKGLDK